MACRFCRPTQLDFRGNPWDSLIMRNGRPSERKTVEIPIFKPEFVARYYSGEEIASRHGAVFDLSESDMSAIADNRKFKTTETLPTIKGG
jgi:hypothetical protein